jgi:hypothetical protein
MERAVADIASWATAMIVHCTILHSIINIGRRRICLGRQQLAALLLPNLDRHQHLGQRHGRHQLHSPRMYSPIHTATRYNNTCQCGSMVSTLGLELPEHVLVIAIAGLLDQSCCSRSCTSHGPRSAPARGALHQHARVCTCLAARLCQGGIVVVSIGHGGRTASFLSTPTVHFGCRPWVLLYGSPYGT